MVARNHRSDAGRTRVTIGCVYVCVSSVAEIADGWRRRSSWRSSSTRTFIVSLLRPSATSLNVHVTNYLENKRLLLPTSLKTTLHPFPRLINFLLVESNFDASSFFRSKLQHTGPPFCARIINERTSAARLGQERFSLPSPSFVAKE